MRRSARQVLPWIGLLVVLSASAYAFYGAEATIAPTALAESRTAAMRNPAVAIASDTLLVDVKDFREVALEVCG